MSDPDPNTERARRLSAQALQEAGVLTYEDSKLISIFSGTIVYWQHKGDDIEITFRTWGLFSDRIKVSISFHWISEHVARSFPNDAEAIRMLVAVLDHIKATTSELMPEVFQAMITRRMNRLADSIPEIGEFWSSKWNKPVSLDIDKRRAKRLKELRGERRQRKTWLEKTRRAKQHEVYDRLFEIAKSIKPYYDDLHRRYNKEHSQQTVPFEQWQSFWIDHAVQFYEYEKDFLALFADQDEPSASELAYRHMATDTRHSRSYIEKIVRKSRQEAGKTKRRKRTSKTRK